MASESKPSPISNLSIDTLGAIADYLPPAELAKFQTTSKIIQNNVKYALTWENKIQRVDRWHWFKERATRPHLLPLDAIFQYIIFFYKLPREEKLKFDQNDPAILQSALAGAPDPDTWPQYLEKAARIGNIALVKWLCQFVYVKSSVLEAAILSGNYDLVAWLLESKDVKRAMMWEPSDNIDNAIKQLPENVQPVMAKKLFAANLIKFEFGFRINIMMSLRYFLQDLFPFLSRAGCLILFAFILTGYLNADLSMFFIGLLITQGLIAVGESLKTTNKFNYNLLILLIFVMGLALIFLLNYLINLNLFMGFAILTSIMAILQLIEIPLQFHDFQLWGGLKSLRIVLFLILFTVMAFLVTYVKPFAFAPFLGSAASLIIGTLIAINALLLTLYTLIRTCQTSRIEIPDNLMIPQPAIAAVVDSTTRLQLEVPHIELIERFESLDVKDSKSDETSSLIYPTTNSRSDFFPPSPRDSKHNTAQSTSHEALVGGPKTEESKTGTLNAIVPESKKDEFSSLASRSGFLPPPSESKRNTANSPSTPLSHPPENQPSTSL